MGSGTIVNPFTLAEALVSTHIQPGQTLWLRGGTYQNDYVCTLAGTNGNPIVIKPYPGEKPVINGSLTINGAYTFWQNLEVWYSGWEKRESDFTGSGPADMPLTKKLEINGTGVVCDGIIAHDLAGVNSFSTGVGTKIYNSLFYNIGWVAPDRGHGHGIYLQNTGTTEKLIKNSVIFNNFGWGIHGYTEGGHIDWITADACTTFRNGVLGGHQYLSFIGGYVIPDYPTIKNCMTYEEALGLGYDVYGFDHATLTDNYTPGGISKLGTPKNFNAESNNYTGPGIGNTVFVKPYDYQSTRANVTVYNQAAANTVVVDLSTVSGLSVGNTVLVRNVQDYFADIQTLVLDADKKITVNMQAVNRTVCVPVEWTAPATTFPEFGCMAIEKA
jgi:hypothetical protein